MRLYLDDDSVEAVLIRLLRRAGHDVINPADIGRSGANDAVHERVAIFEDRTLLSRNHDDFKELHELVLTCGGHHTGILIVRSDNDPTRDMKAAGIVRAIANLLVAGAPIRDELIILNHWR